MKNILTSILLILLMSCGSKPGHGGMNGKDNVADSGKDPNSSNEDQIDPISDESKELELITPAGSKMRMLNAQALTRLYRHVFPEEKYGFQHCASGEYGVYEFCHDSIFNQDERILMGAFALSFNGVAKSNVSLSDTLTLNYMRSLRAGLGRECKFLVAREYANLQKNQAQTNRLIKGASPKAEDLEEFYRTILGIGGSKIAVDIGAANYVAIFDKSIGQGSDAEIQGAYSAICVAVAMDPSIIIY